MRKRVFIPVLVGLFVLPGAPEAFSQSRRKRPVILNNPLKVNPIDSLEMAPEELNLTPSAGLHA